ncbi:MAG TPA: hypothetical protein VG051_02240 [Candidatus Acidoferrum sp.]|jgi:hypothetical protein|nr:hypothetical protein [Candidatus Acidoferrum sp.]
MKRLFCFACSLVALTMGAFIAGCGGGGYTPTPPPPPVINVSVSPTFGAMDQGQSVTFTATTNDASGKGVNWSLSGLGMLTSTTSSSTTYQAPSSGSGPAQVMLTATSVTNPADSFPFGFTVTPPPTISPGMPDGNVGTAYNNRITVMNGTANFTFVLTGGTMPPPGLMMDGSGNVFGTPTGTPQTYNFSVNLTDASPGGNVVVPGNVSIKIDPPLPLMITTPTAPAGAVGFSYDFPIFATGGVQPYTFSLATGSSALPAGLGPLGTSNNQGVIAGTPTTAGMTSNILVQVTDSQTPPITSTPPTNYSITINPSTSFVGTQAPGDIWQLLISHSDATHGIFKESDQGNGGLPGTISFSRTKFFFPTIAGFRRDIAHIFCSLFPRRCTTIFGYAVEMQDEMALIQPDGMGSRVVASVANSCPQLSAAASYQFVTLPTKTFTTTDAAYGNVGVTQISTSPKTYSLITNTFLLDTTASTVNSMQTGVLCDSTLQVLSFTGNGPGPTTMAFSGHGALVIDNGLGIPSVGLQQPGGALSTSGTNGILAGQYLGVLFQPNMSPGSLANPGPISQMVGFGPSTGTTLTGGIYVSPDTDPISNHLTDHVITLGTQAPTSPGLFTGGTLAIGTNPVIKNFDVVAGVVNNKFVLYGIGLDTSNSSSPQPTAVLLIQQ